VIEYEKLATQRFKLASAPELWQFDLLTPQKICQFAKDRGVQIFNAGAVIDLWRLGLLRSDLIIASSKLEMSSLEIVSVENGQFTYCDKRRVEHKAQGYGGTITATKFEFDSLELLFHPFRLYVLYQIDRVFRSNSASTQYLMSPKGLITIDMQNIDFLNRWTSSKEFSERMDEWNKTAELAIVLEPAAYTAVFHSMRLRFPDTQESIMAKLQEHRERVRQFLSEVPVNEINKVREVLCQNAELLDENKLVHVLLRLMSQHERLKLRSDLGGCMQFLCMAEIIRRAAEDALDQHLPEEDEMGFGQWMAGARKSLYGSERILDSPRETRREFLTSMGLDYGVKVRCYFEGDTEIGALTSAVGEASGTEFINLRGQFVEKHGKGLNFVASLKNDKKSHIFSVVMLDQDRDDNIRALKNAAINRTFFGRFFISSPDFEFANFTVSELVDILLGFAWRDNDRVPAKSEIMPLVATATSSRQFFDALHRSGITEIGKSESWGVALMNYALKHPKLPSDHIRSGSMRPVIEVSELLVIAREAGYLRSLETYRVDPNTGELREK
jgi:hypothetical protein